MKKSKQTAILKLEPTEHLIPDRSRKIQTMIETLISSIDDKFISIEELKYVVKEVERKLKERKKNERNYRKTS